METSSPEEGTDEPVSRRHRSIIPRRKIPTGSWSPPLKRIHLVQKILGRRARYSRHHVRVPCLSPTRYHRLLNSATEFSTSSETPGTANRQSSINPKRDSEYVGDIYIDLEVEHRQILQLVGGPSALDSRSHLVSEGENLPDLRWRMWEDGCSATQRLQTAESGRGLPSDDENSLSLGPRRCKAPVW